MSEKEIVELLKILQEIKKGCELIGIASIVMTIVVELEDSIYWEVENLSEDSLGYCQNMLSGWKLSAKEILEIIDPQFKNEIKILEQITELTL